MFCTLAKDILPGSLEGSRKKGVPMKTWHTNITEEEHSRGWTCLQWLIDVNGDKLGKNPQRRSNDLKTSHGTEEDKCISFESKTL